MRYVDTLSIVALVGYDSIVREWYASEIKRCSMSSRWLAIGDRERPVSLGCRPAGPDMATRIWIYFDVADESLKRRQLGW